MTNTSVVMRFSSQKARFMHGALFDDVGHLSGEVRHSWVGHDEQHGSAAVNISTDLVKCLMRSI